jgi:inosine/xanthosine triphosphatase
MNQQMKQVTVGSINPVKIEAVRLGFFRIFPQEKWKVTGCQVDSLVKSQPLSDLEAILGARNRAKAALIKNKADYGVGVEGGLQQVGKNWFSSGWVVVIDRDGVEGIGSTARIITPPKMMDQILIGKELGEVVDHYFQTKNAKQAEGHFGLMTKGAITRTSGYRDGVIMALTRFIHPRLF